MPPIKRTPDQFIVRGPLSGPTPAAQLAQAIVREFPEARDDVSTIFSQGAQLNLSQEDTFDQLRALQNRMRGAVGPPVLAPMVAPQVAVRMPTPAPLPVAPIGPLVVLPPGVDPTNVLVVTQRFPVGRSVGFVAGGRTLIPVIRL